MSALIVPQLLLSRRVSQSMPSFLHTRFQRQCAPNAPESGAVKPHAISYLPQTTIDSLEGGMTIEQAMRLAEQECPFPQLAGVALRTLCEHIANLEHELSEVRCPGLIPLPAFNKNALKKLSNLTRTRYEVTSVTLRHRDTHIWGLVTRSGRVLWPRLRHDRIVREITQE